MNELLRIIREEPFWKLLTIWLLINLQGVWEYSNCSLWEQGWCEKQAGEGQASHIPQEEEPTVLWNICEE